MTATTEHPGKTIYEENLLYLREKAPQLLQTLLSLPMVRGKTEPAKNGSLTLRYTVNRESFYIHSRFNPTAEAEKLLKKKDMSADHFVVMGLGLGYHLDKLMDWRDPLSRVLLVEPDLEMAAHSLHTIRWRKLLDCKDFFFVLGTDLGDLSPTLHQFIHIAIFDTMEIIELPSETRLMEPFFQKARETVDSEVRSFLYDFQTRLAESYAVPRNVFKNLPYIMKSRPISGLKEKLKGTPGFIVAAGPSLDANILHLKKIRDRGIIIAVDTALKPLLSRSIQPHFTAIGDPSHKNYLHVQGTGSRVEHFILAETGVAHQVFRDFPGNLFTLSIDRPIVRILENHSQPLGTLQAWGTVTCIALDFAVYLGLNPIVFVGQDFSYSRTRNHCRGTSWEEKQVEHVRDLDQMQRFEKSSITGNRKVVEEKDIYGNTAYTSDRLVLYKNFLARVIEGYPGTRFINASEGGIFTEIPGQPLYDVLQRYVFGRPAVDLDKIRGVPILAGKNNLRSLQGFLKQSHAFFHQYHDGIGRALELLEPGKTAGLSMTESLALIQESERLQRLPYSGKTLENGELIEMWSPAPTYYFLKAYRRIHKSALSETSVKETLDIYRKYFINIKPLVKDIAAQLDQSGSQLAEIQI